MTFKDISDMVCMAARASRDILQYMDNTCKRNYGYLHGYRWTNEQIKDMEKKEPKRDKKGRIVKKCYNTEVKLEVEPKPASKHPKRVSISEDELKQLKTERDAFKLTAEKMSGKYLDKCQEVKDLMPYKRHWDHLFGLAMTWKDRALVEQEKHLFAMDALRVACMQIWWLRGKLSWFKFRKYRKKLAEMDIELDRYIERVEGLDKE